MDWMRVVRQVDELPDLRCAQGWLLGDRRMPRSIVQHHPHGALNIIHPLIERKPSRLNTGSWIEPQWRPQDAWHHTRIYAAFRGNMEFHDVKRIAHQLHMRARHRRE